MKASGILFVTKDRRGLFLRRSETASDAQGCWDLPGGARESEETAEETAVRECREEIGFVPDGKRTFHTRTKVGIGSNQGIKDTPVDQDHPAVDFVTFIQRVGNEFTPELNYEHDGFAWAPLDSPPEPLHPGVRIAIERTKMNELGVARAIADGRLTSPQQYENLWLFAIRITGTDVAYRTKFGEFVFRRPENYLNEEFLARCNGLPVVWHHPPKGILDGKEFAKRIVGTVFLPYIAGDEVWAVVKIFDSDIARLMGEQTWSTSPGVNFEDFGVNATLRMEDGSKLLIEGDPSAIDHVAICELGVWDKGGEPTGIRAENREDCSMAMADDDAKKRDDDAAKVKKDAEDKERMAAEDKAKKDAEECAKNDKAKRDAEAGMGTQLDKILSHLDAMGKRMDAFEERDKEREDAMRKDAAMRKDEGDDPEKLAAMDKSKKDAEESEKEKEKEKSAADKAKKDAEEEKERDDKRKAKADDDIRARIEEIKKMIPRSYGDDDYHALTDAQVRADDVFAKFGEHAPRPLNGEVASGYDRRVIRKLKEHSAVWKGVDTDNLPKEAFEIAKNQVYADATKAALAPTSIGVGQLRALKSQSGGHEFIEYHGEPNTWMNQFAGPVGHTVKAFHTPNNRA